MKCLKTEEYVQQLSSVKNIIALHENLKVFNFYFICKQAVKNNKKRENAIIILSLFTRFDIQSKSADLKKRGVCFFSGYNRN